MNGIDKITGQIDADVRREVDAMIEDARAKAEETLRQSEQRGEKEAADLLERGKKAAAEQEERLVSMARLEGRKQVLAAKQDLVAEAFDKALEQLVNLPEEECVPMLAALAAKASSTGKEKVVLSQRDRARYGKKIVTRANEPLGEHAMLTLAEETRPIQGGFILLGDRVEMNCSYEGLVRLQKESMTAQVAQVLFQDA